jgi:hypothetical protein
MRELERRSSMMSDPIARRSRTERPAPVEALLRLQRTSGNRAVAGLLAPGRPTIARFGVQVRTQDDDEQRWVSDIRVVGRPKRRLIAGAEGSHVTAWAVFADIARRQLVGLEPARALAVAKEMLVTQADSLRGEWPQPRPEAVSGGLTEAAKALGDLPEDVSGGSELSQLQEVIGAYLTLHNLRPGTTVLLGKGQAFGAGEPKFLSALRSHEMGQDQDRDVLHEALFGLLDIRALTFIRNLRAATPAAPGVDARDADRVGQSVLNGLEDLAAAYPRSYAKVITDSDVVTTWLSDNGLPSTLPGSLPDRRDVEAAPENWSRTGTSAAEDVGKRNAVCQIVLKRPGAMTDGEEQPPVVKDVRMSGRPPTLTKGEQGHHTVAWSLEMLRLVKLLKGLPLNESAGELLSICEETIAELGEGLEWLAAEDELDEDGDYSEENEYTRETLGAARDDLRAQVDSLNPDGSDTLVVLEAMQELVAAWMRAVNVMPLGSSDEGAYPNSRGESTALPALKGYEKAARSKSRKRKLPLTTEQLWINLLRLFDRVAVEYLHTDEHVGRAYPAESDKRTGVIVRRFLRACEVAFAHAYADTGIGTEAGVRRLLGHVRVLFTSVDDVIAIALGEEPGTGAEVDVGEFDFEEKEEEPATKRPRRAVSRH